MITSVLFHFLGYLGAMNLQRNSISENKNKTLFTSVCFVLAYQKYFLFLYHFVPLYGGGGGTRTLLFQDSMRYYFGGP